MMNPKLKGPWVEALRSGQYEQAKGQLSDAVVNSAQGYCCMGVLCEVNGWSYLESDNGTTDGPVELVGEYVETDEGTEYVLPESGLSVDTRDRLATMNDDYEFSFAEIADWIENNL